MTEDTITTNSTWGEQTWIVYMQPHTGVGIVRSVDYQVAHPRGTESDAIAAEIERLGVHFEAWVEIGWTVERGCASRVFRWTKRR